MTTLESASPIGELHGMVWTACMAALMAVGAFLFIPLPWLGVPFTMQTFFVYLTGFMLGPVGGVLAVLLYVTAGVAGLPVFSGGSSGILALMGPTGGFFPGFALSTLCTGMASRRYRSAHARIPGRPAMFLWGLAGMVLLFVPGILWLYIYLDGKATLAEASMIVLPFFGLDFVKLAGAVATYRYLLSRRLAPR